MSSTEFRKAHAALAVHGRRRPNEDNTDLRRNFATAKIADVIQEVIASAPPLRRDQIERLRRMLPLPTESADERRDGAA